MRTGRVAFLTMIALAAALTTSVSPSSADHPNVLNFTLTTTADEFQAVPDGIYQHLQIRDGVIDDLRSHIGQPSIPLLNAWFILPPGKVMERVELVPELRVVLPGHYQPYPVRAAEDSLDAPDEPPWPPAVYPDHGILSAEDGDSRNYHLLKLSYYPLEYDARTQELTLLGVQNVTIRLRDKTAEEERRSIRVLRPEAIDGPFGSHRKWIEETIRNREDLDTFYPRYVYTQEVGQNRQLRTLSEEAPYGTFVSKWPSLEGLAVPYVIVTNDRDESGNSIDGMAAAFKELASTLTDYGLMTQVRTIDEIEAEGSFAGYDRPETIRRFLISCLQRWGTAYVLLGGDIDIVPTRRLGPATLEAGTFGRPDPPADCWYARFGKTGDANWDEGWNTDGDAWIGETAVDIGTGGYNGLSQVSIGRLPARNAAEAVDMVTKIQRYRLFGPYGGQRADASYYNSCLAVSGPTFSMNPGWSGMGQMETCIADPMDALQGWSVRRLYPDFSYPRCSPTERCYAEMDDFVNQHAPSDPRWVGTALRDELNNGYHLAVHIEHSIRTRWGKPSQKPIRVGYDCPLSSTKLCDDLLKGVWYSTEHLDQNEALHLTNGITEPRFFIGMSGGCWTNMIDMNSIGECFMRAKDGGAIAYIGDVEASFSRMTTLGDAAHYIFVPAYSYSVAEALVHAIDDNTADPMSEIKLSIGLPFLGDPSLHAWKRTPLDADLAVTPNPIPSIGITSLTVTVTENGSGDPVVDGLVCVKQGASLYATKRTDATGEAEFAGLLIQDATDSVIVSLLAPEIVPKRVSLPIAVSAPSVVYSSHSLDDCVTAGDCDGVMEVGETIEADVTLKNQGSSTTQPGMAVLRPTPSFDCKLKINEEYRPGDILIGKQAAHPTTTSDNFSLPMTREGVRVEGEPNPAILNRESLRVWRVGGTGLYTIGAISPSRCQDSVFTGVIKGRADFSDVVMTGEQNDDFFWSGDSIWFRFRGDGTEDKITFRAEAPSWLGISAPNAPIPSLAPGDSTTVTYPIEIKAPTPDRENLVFTVSAYQSLMATRFFYSDFAISVAKPIVVPPTTSMEFGDFGCPDTTWAWTPLIHNIGSGEADSVRVTLRKTSGIMTVLDSLITLTGVGPDSIASNGSFLLCGSSPADTVGFAASIRTEVFHKNLYVQIEAPIHGGFCGPPMPGDLGADLAQGTIILHWNPIAEASAYLIECRNSESGQNLWTATIDAKSSRYEVRGEELKSPSGQNAYNYPYHFWVSAIRDGVHGQKAHVGPVFPWVHEREGWPVLLPETSVCAPSVMWLGPEEDAGTVILGAGARIYAFRPNGDPLDPSSSTGLFYDPIPPGSQPAADMRFTEALACGSWMRVPDGDAGLFIAGNLAKDGVHLVELVRNLDDQHWEASLYHEYPFYSMSSPVVAGEVYPYQNHSAASVLWVPGMTDAYVNGIVVDDTPEPYGDANWHFAHTDPEGSTYNYDALALGHRNEPGWNSTEVIAASKGVAVKDGWKRGRVACYSTWDPRPAFPRWTDSLDVRSFYPGTDQWVSTPAVGDVDGDGDYDVVVMTMWRCLNSSCSNMLDGKIAIIDENTGIRLPCTGCESPEFHFLRESRQFPPAGAALADVDNDGAVEIIVAGNTSDGDSNYEAPVSLRIDVLDYDAETGILNDAFATQDIPFNTRNEEQGNVNDNDIGNGGAVYPIGSPVVGETDFDGDCRPDIFVSTSVGAIYGFEYDPTTRTVSPKRGWPLLLPDVPREPVLVTLDPEQYSMVVQCADGWLHVFDLPKPSETAGSCGTMWAGYGGNLENARQVLNGGWFEKETADETPAATRLARVGPVPSTGGQDILIELAQKERIDLGLYDLGGRRVATVYQGALAAGPHRLHWDGKASGRPIASGAYWYRLKWATGAESRKITVLR